MDVAAFLSDMLGIDPGSFMYDSSITAGTVIAVARPAIKFRELPGSPIRVTAENIPNGGRDSGDRKSTRLNSSHVSISYAVFCLKKKKIARVTRYHSIRRQECTRVTPAS